MLSFTLVSAQTKELVRPVERLKRFRDPQPYRDLLSVILFLQGVRGGDFPLKAPKKLPLELPTVASLPICT